MNPIELDSSTQFGIVFSLLVTITLLTTNDISQHIHKSVWWGELSLM